MWEAYEMRFIRLLLVLGAASAILFLGIEAASGQTYLPSLSGPADVSLMPDLQQPNPLILQAGGLVPPLSWPNHCAPVSAANIWKFFDARNATNLSPWSGSLPQPGPPFGWGVSWSAATIEGQGTVPGPPFPPLLPPVYMDTNSVSMPLPAWPGTRIQDAFRGIAAYAQTVISASGLSKSSYNVPLSMDEVFPYLPPSPPRIQLMVEPAAYLRYINSITRDIPAVVCFDRWVKPGTGLQIGGIEYYDFVNSTTGDAGYGSIEQWNGSETGHAVTGIGFRRAFDPDGPMGALPLADWYITRDNWMTTGTDVAVPAVGHWMATIYTGTPAAQVIKWSQPPTQNPLSPFPECYWGWDEPSIYGNQIVADDWLCSTTQPVTDVHWWGSYLAWNQEIPPASGPVHFQIGVWTDVPAGVDTDYSHPGIFIWEWRVDRAELNERYVGCDYYPGHLLDSCFRYDFIIPEEQWFYQDPGPATGTVYWLSIAAVYTATGTLEYPWGWKTREHYFNDDAIRILVPGDPQVGDPFVTGIPIEATPGVSFDAAFELTTHEILTPTPTPTPTALDTETPTPTDTEAPTSTHTPTPVATSTNTQPPLSTPTPTDTGLVVPTPTDTEAPTSTHTPTPVATSTNTQPPLSTPTPTDTGLVVPTPTDTQSVQVPTPTFTPGPPLKWSQPPVFDPAAPDPSCYYGWDEPSAWGLVVEGSAPKDIKPTTFTIVIPLVADDWLCSDARPVTDIHWWGSYTGWNGQDPPPTAPSAFHIGIWTDTPAGTGVAFSHPNTMIKEWTALRLDTNEIAVGCDSFPGKGTDTCFRYDLILPSSSEWFFQAPSSGSGTVYWISIGAIYDEGADPANLWGWKTRPHFYNDDAVRILSPNAPLLFSMYISGEPIEEPQGVSWDMAFELTTNSVGPEPTATNTQPPLSTPTPTDTGLVVPTETETAIATETPTGSVPLEPTATNTPPPATSTPTRTPCLNSADLNGDGVVNAKDLIEFIRQWHGQPSLIGASADLDCDGEIDYEDLMVFQLSWY